MPLSAKRKRQRRHIEETYEKMGEGAKKGKSVFYAMENSGKLGGGKRKAKRKKRRSSRR